MAALEHLTLDQFEAHVNQHFRLVGEPSVLALELIEARSLSIGERAEPATGERRAPFSLVFRGPGEPVLPQRIYHLEHVGALGALDIFLVPIGPDQQGMCYEAVFA